jgi:hypothetical protein
MKHLRILFNQKNENQVITNVVTSDSIRSRYDKSVHSSSFIVHRYLRQKPIILLLAFLGVFSIPANAGLKFGVKTGVNLAKASFNTETLRSGNFTGFQVGPILDFAPPVFGIGMDIAALYSQQGLKIKNLSLEVRESTLDVPLNLKFKFGLVGAAGVFLTAGPYASFRLEGKNLNSIVKNMNHDFRHKSFGAGLNFGFGISLGQHLQVGANYKYGMTDDYKSFIDKNNKDWKVKTRVWSISAAFFF